MPQIEYLIASLDLGANFLFLAPRDFPPPNCCYVCSLRDVGIFQFHVGTLCESS